MPHRRCTPNSVTLAQVLHIGDDTRHIKWVRKFFSAHNTLYLPTKSHNQLVYIQVPHSMSCQGLARIDTHSVHLQVCMEPFCASTVPVPQEFRFPLPLLLPVCNLSLPFLHLHCSCCLHFHLCFHLVGCSVKHIKYISTDKANDLTLSLIDGSKSCMNWNWNSF